MKKFKKLAMRTHLEVQQREDISRDLAETDEVFSFRAGENVFLLARRSE